MDFLKRYWRGTLCVLAISIAVLAPIRAAITSSDFRNCEQHQGQYPTTANEGNKTSPILIPAPAFTRIEWACIGGYTNVNGSAITAIATALLTIVTGLLGLLAWDQARSSRSQLRAWVSVDSATVADGTNIVPENTPKIGFAGTAIVIKNSGQTPAFRVVHWGALDVTKIDNPSLQSQIADKTSTSSNIPAGGATNKAFWMDTKLSDSQLLGIRAGTIGVFVHGTISYRDIFDEPRTTKYRMYWSGAWPPPKDPVLAFHIKGNDMT